MKRYGFFLILLLFSIVSGVFFVSSDNNSDLEKLKKQQESIQNQINKTKSLINQKKSQTKNVSNQIKNLDSQLDEQIKSLEEVEQQMTVLEQKIVETQKELETVVADANNHRDLIDKRVRIMYQSGYSGYLDVLFSSESFSDFISRFELVKKIVQSDSEILVSMKEYQEKVDQKKMQLDSEQQEKENLLSNINEKKNSTELTLKDKEKAMQDLKNDLKELERLEDKLIQESSDIGRKIVSLQSKEKYIGGKLLWPSPGYTKITSPFGYRIHPVLKTKKLHTGIDIAVPANSKIVAANSGKVIYAGYYGGYGNAVIIDHGGKISTLYAHNNKLLVKEGDTVAKGDTISKSGSTGLSTGPHLHFEVRENGKCVDPLPYLKGK